MDADDRGYHREHTWAKAEGQMVRIGITDHAQDELDSVVYVDLPLVAVKSYTPLETAHVTPHSFQTICGHMVLQG